MTETTKIAKFTIVAHVDFATVVFPKDEALRLALRAAFPKARWASGTRVWSIPGPLAYKRLLKWASDRAAEAEAAAAAQARLAQDMDFDAQSLGARRAEIKSTRVKISGMTATYDFVYDPSAVEIARALPGARFDGATKAWSWTITSRDHVQALIEGLNAIYEIAGRVLQARADAKAALEAERQAEQSARDQHMALVRSQRSYVLASASPAVGETARLSGRIVVVESLGRPFRAGDDVSSLGGPVGCEGEWIRYAYWRLATDAERASFEAAEAAATAERQRAATIATARREALAEIDRDGEAAEIGHAPEGETLWSDERHAATGLRRWAILTPDGAWVWSITYDGSDGSAWGDYNLGYNTQGRRLPATAARVAAIRGVL